MPSESKIVTRIIIAVIMAGILSGVGFSWDTNADVAVMKVKIQNISDDVNSLTDKLDEITKQLNATIAIDGVQNTSIANDSVRLENHKEEKDAH
jgi:outer membrane murein-binding lipoprotein Lpp